MKTKFMFLLAVALTMGIFLQTAKADATKTVGGAGTDYSTLKLAMDAINNGLITGAITLQITGSTSETATAKLNASGNGLASYTSVKIYPTITGLSISGNLTTLVNLSGANYVTIDGRVDATDGNPKNLIIENKNTAGTTVQLSSASNNIVQYVIIKGGNLGTYGVFNFSYLTGATKGSCTNLIDHCDFTNSEGNRPNLVIYSRGDATNLNTNNTISYCDFYDNIGLSGTTGNTSTSINLVSNNNEWTIDNNSVYETTTLIPTSAESLRAIQVYASAGQNFTITNNYIGGDGPKCGTGKLIKTNGQTNIFYGFCLSNGNFTVTGNTVKNISWSDNNTASTNSYCFYFGSTGTVDVSNNTIGESEGNGSLTFTGTGDYAYTFSAIFLFTFVAGTKTINGNHIGSIALLNTGAGTAGTTFNGISGAFTSTINNNLIGSLTTTNSISTPSSAGAHLIYGIWINTDSTTPTVDHNTISNITNGSTGTSGKIWGIYNQAGVTAITNNTINDLTISNNNSLSPSGAMIGIYQGNTSNYGQNISQNTIYNLSNDNIASTGYVTGILAYGTTSGTSTMDKNLIYGLKAASNLAKIAGIYCYSGDWTCSNNMVSIGKDCTSGASMYGIYNNIILKLYYNTVKLQGTVSGTTNSTYALHDVAFSKQRTFTNNLLINERNGGTSGFHYAIKQLSITSLTIDYNDYYAPNGVLGNFGVVDKTSLALWQGATTQDANSKNKAVSFVSGTDLHLSGISLSDADIYGGSITTGITTDYDGLTRHATRPYKGADEIRMFTWDGSESTDWNTAANWDLNEVPTGSDVILVPDVAQKPLISTFSVLSGGTLTIDPKSSLTLSGAINNNGTIFIRSEADWTGSLITGSGGIGTGSVQVERYMPAGEWHIISSPTATQKINDFIADNTCIPYIPASGSIVDKYGMMDYNTADNKWNDYFTDSNTSPLGVGKGYMVRVLDPVRNLKFLGAINTDASTAVSVGWNCIGNPFTSAIKVNTAAGSDNFMAVNFNEFDPSNKALYLWNQTNGSGTGSYDVVNLAGGAAYAQVGQGFFMKVKAAGSGSVSFTTAMRTHQINAPFKAAVAPYPEIKLIAKANGKTFSTDIKFIEGTKKGLDPGYDAGLFTTDKSYAIYTKLVEDNGVNFQLQCLPTNDYSKLVIPVGIDSKAAGEIVFSVETVQLEAGCKVILEDKLTNTFTDLSKNSYKTAVKANTAGTGRFFLHTGDIVSDLEDQSLTDGMLTAYVKGNKEIRVLGEVGEGAVATLFNGLGQVVLTKKLGSGNLNIIGLPNLTSGLYMLNINDKGAPRTIKIMVRK
jgi:hypothetical protein